MLVDGKFVTDAEIDNIYSFHPPKDEYTKDAHEQVRASVRKLAHELNNMLAESPQKTHLLRQVLPEVMMRANQIVAINGVTHEFRDHLIEVHVDKLGG
jgi:chemotaxis regulatin CheY-phosphate phosphatase CheZ